jgi:RHS repeat-associated protein
VFIEERNNQWNTPYLFNAKELDEETGLYYYGARYYDPRVSIWLSTDPLAEKSIDKTSYHFCSNNPLSRIDSNGLYDIENVKKGKESEVKTVAVFGKQTIKDDKVIRNDYKAAKKAGVGILLVDDVNDFADGMAELTKMGIDPSVYAINSHGADGYFEVGSTPVFKSTTGLNVLKSGLQNKYVFIGACEVSSGSNGKELIQNFSRETSSSVIASAHLVPAGYKYNGKTGVNYMGPIGDFLGLFGKNWNNDFHISQYGGTASQIYNLTINKNGKVTWDSGNVALPYRGAPKPTMLPSDFNMWNSLQNAFPR